MSSIQIQRSTASTLGPGDLAPTSDLCTMPKLPLQLHHLGKLTEQYSEFVEQLIASGRYKNASVLLRAGVRLLEKTTAEEQEKPALLRNRATDGIGQLDRGQGIAIPNLRQLASHIAKLGRPAANSVNRQKVE